MTMDPKAGMVMPGMVMPGAMMAAPTMQPPIYMPQGQGMVATPMGMMAQPVQYAPVPIANPIAPMFFAFPQDHAAAPAMNTLTRKLASVGKIKVVQQITLLEACCGCEQQNIYSIYDEQGNQILQAKEKSDTCTRLFCNPCHSLMVEISDAGNEDDVIVTMERPGLDCGSCGKPCLPCFACMSCCTEEATLHGGRVEGPAGNVKAPAPMAMMRQALASESPFNPKINITPAVTQVGGEDVSMSVTGPTFFGGCSELCCRSSFPVVNSKGEPAGVITKLPPRNCCSFLDEIATDADTYQIEYESGTCPEDKAAILASAILADYMFFEGDNGMCRRDPLKPNGAFKCTLFMCYCCGVSAPCNLSAGGGEGGGGGGG
ncbi:hypothetical protein TrRE_jg1337 [Triparma retinervis]|uniref:Phospholipid scramblase n=1 Tax=Triparma retinervis TaxID=2557542 RepID=A0A9W6ZWP1_9STRA|nr:hypothetical protein TrRE_jg1337 [Triparma retinervis]